MPAESGRGRCGRHGRVALLAIAAVSALYAERQRHFAVEEAKANRRNSKLADDLTTSLKESNSRLAAQHLQRGSQRLSSAARSARACSGRSRAGGRQRAADDPRGAALRQGESRRMEPRVSHAPAVFSHARPIIAVAISPDGKTVATAVKTDRHGSGISHAALRSAHPLEHPGVVLRVMLQPRWQTGSRRAARRLCVYGMRPAANSSARCRSRSSSRLSPTPPGARGLFACGDIGSSQVWDTASEKPLGSLSERTGSGTVMASSPDGKTILTCSHEGDVRLWDAETLRPIGSPSERLAACIWAATFSPDGKTILLGAGGRARVVGRRHEEVAWADRWHMKVECGSSSFSPDGKTILTGSNDKTARLWNAATQTPIGPVYRQEGPIEGGPSARTARRS